MNFSISNIGDEQSYTSSVTSETKSKSNKSQKSHTKKQIVSEKEGNYCCKYIVDGTGQKTLLSKVPIQQSKKQDSSQKLTNSDETASCQNVICQNSQAAFDVKQEIHKQLAHKDNLKEILNILKGTEGISSTSNKSSYF